MSSSPAAAVGALGPSPDGHVTSFLAASLAHGAVAVPDPRAPWTHLSFRRFAGCPICNLHLRDLADRQVDLVAAGISTVAFMVSSAEAMRPYQGDLPFPVIPDPERRWFDAFGVRRSAAAILHPTAMWTAARGMLSVRSHPLRGDGGHDGLPADFLLARDGRVVAAHHGRHAADAWRVDELLARVAALGQP